jgi:membrane protein YdbS with pleckstrin-like domain
MATYRFLSEDESVTLDAHRHLSGCITGVLSSVALILVVALVWHYWGTAPRGAHIAMACAMGLVAVVELVRVARFRSHRLIITTDRVVVRDGVVHQPAAEVDLSEITNVAVHQRLLQRVVGIGAVEITAGGLAEPLHIRQMSHPKRLAATLRSAIERAEAHSAEAPLSAPTPVPLLSGAQDDQLEHLQRLHARGVISDEEFGEEMSRLGS